MSTPPASGPEGFADRSVALIGSVGALIVYSILTVVYVGFNVIGPVRFDPYPFQLYTMSVSVLAILMAILILIAESRSAVTDRATQRHISETADDLAVMQREQTEILRAEMAELKALHQIEQEMDDTLKADRS